MELVGLASVEKVGYVEFPAAGHRAGKKLAAVLRVSPPAGAAAATAVASDRNMHLTWLFPSLCRSKLPFFLLIDQWSLRKRKKDLNLIPSRYQNINYQAHPEFQIQTSPFLSTAELSNPNNMKYIPKSNISE